jgi:hypothetical protein
MLRSCVELVRFVDCGNRAELTAFGINHEHSAGAVSLPVAGAVVIRSDDVQRSLNHSDSACFGSTDSFSHEPSPLHPNPPNHALTPNVAKSKPLWLCHFSHRENHRV